MKAISQGNIKRFLVAAGVALAVPLTAVAFQGHPGGHHGCGDFAGHGGPGMMGGEMLPPHLRGLNLTEAQRDKIFEIMHAQAPVMRDKAKALRKAETDLHALTANAHAERGSRDHARLIALPSSVPSDADGAFILSPVALQAALEAIPTPTGDAFAPVSMASLQVFRPARAAAFAWVRASMAHPGVFDLDLCDAQGRIAVVIRGLSAVQIAPRANAVTDVSPKTTAPAASFAEAIGDKAAAQRRASDFLNHYHRPTDRYDPAWNLEGLLQQVRFALELGRLSGR